MKMGTRYGMGKRLLLAMALSSFFLATALPGQRTTQEGEQAI